MSQARTQSRTFGSGSKRVLAITPVLAFVAAVAVALLPGHGRPVAKYGGLPKWLPETTVSVGRVVDASPAHSVLAIEGDTVAVHLPAGGVFATVVGPEVPESGKFPVPPTTPCTFVVTFAKASGRIPITAADFTITDEQGRLHHPRLSALDGGAPPSEFSSAAPTSLRLYSVLPTGSGSVAWAPGGSRPVVSWDFDVEID
jgi:hypothetical protein